MGAPLQKTGILSKPVGMSGGFSASGRKPLTCRTVCARVKHGCCQEQEEGTAMQIEITGETEQLIQAALATGKFATVQEFISVMTSHWKQRQAGVSRETIPPMPERVELSTILTEQNVKPCTNPEGLKTDLWPSNESTDEFLAFLRESRRDRIESTGNR